MKKDQIYKCDTCGSMVEVLCDANGTLSCCGKPMRLLNEMAQDGALEKHVPVVEKIDGGVKVMVGEVFHPMEENHYIQWIEIFAGGKIYRKHLNPGEEPVATFMIDEEVVYAREYCNLHGLWKS